MSAAPALPFSSLEQLKGTHRFTVDEYHRLAEIGVLEWEEALELLEGYIVHKGGRGASPLRPVGRPEWAALRRFTVPEYHAIIAAGILKSGDPVELIDGYLVQKMSRNPPHDAALDLFRAAVATYVKNAPMVRSQQAVTLMDSEPEPDFALVRGGPRSYAARHPRPADILLIVEVSDTSLDLDRGLKGVSYARNGLPVYWVVNLVEEQVEVFTDPDPAATPPGYTTRTVYTRGQSVPVQLGTPVVASVPVADLLP
jgi:hypothetical protein